MVGVRAEGIGVRAWGGGKSSGRGRASTHGAFSWVDGCESDKKTDFEFFWGREGPWSGATEEGVGVGSEPDKKTDFEFLWGRERGVPGRRRQRPGMAWPSGLGGVEGRGRASTARSVFVGWWLEPDKKMILSFCGAGRGGPWSEATEEGVGGGVVRSRAQGGEWWGSGQRG